MSTKKEMITVKKEPIDDSHYYDDDDEEDLPVPKQVTRKRTNPNPPPPVQSPPARRDRAAKVKKEVVKVEPEDSGTDSDSDSEVARVNKRKKKTRKKTTTPRVLLPRRNAVDGGIKIDQSKMIKVSDILTQGTLSSDLLADIEKYYTLKDQHWIDKSTDDLPLYVRDDDENNRQAMLARGVFHAPKVFSLIRHIVEKAPVQNMSLAELQNSVVNLYNIEPIPRWWDEKMLCDPDPNSDDIPCSNGDECLCNVWFGFVMKAFFTPLEQASQSKPKEGVMCLLCQRKAIAFLKTSMKVSGTKPAENYINQRWRNLVTQVGEYIFTDSLTLDNGIIYPVIMNYKNGYRVHSGNSRRWLTQDGYPVCQQEDIDRLKNFINGTLPQRKRDDERSQRDAR